MAYSDKCDEGRLLNFVVLGQLSITIVLYASNDLLAFPNRKLAFTLFIRTLILFIPVLLNTAYKFLNYYRCKNNSDISEV